MLSQSNLFRWNYFSNSFNIKSSLQSRHEFYFSIGYNEVTPTEFLHFHIRQPQSLLEPSYMCQCLCGKKIITKQSLRGRKELFDLIVQFCFYWCQSIFYLWIRANRQRICLRARRRGCRFLGNTKIGSKPGADTQLRHLRRHHKGLLICCWLWRGGHPESIKNSAGEISHAIQSHCRN